LVEYLQLPVHAFPCVAQEMYYLMELPTDGELVGGKDHTTTATRKSKEHNTIMPIVTKWSQRVASFRQPHTAHLWETAISEAR